VRFAASEEVPDSGVVVTALTVAVSVVAPFTSVVLIGVPVDADSEEVPDSEFEI
jgi:hypothetical protein